MPGAGAPSSTDPEAPARARVETDRERLRDETDTERFDRNLIELLQEVRVVQTGVQVLFAFLLTVPFAARIRELSQFQRVDYFVTLLASGAAAVLLIAPTAHHRILFRCGDKEHLVEVANRFTLAGLACVGVSMIGALAFVSAYVIPGPAEIIVPAAAALGMAWCWCIAPMRRRRTIRRSDVGQVLPFR